MVGLHCTAAAAASILGVQPGGTTGRQLGMYYVLYGGWSAYIDVYFWIRT